MWMLFNMLTSPLRSVRMWVIGLGVGLVLLLALANAGPETQGTLGEILGGAVVLVLIRVPMRLVLTLMFAAVVIVSGVSLIREVLASGYVPVAIAVLVLASGVYVWLRAGIPGMHAASLGDAVRQAFHGPPRSRGARWATLRELRRAGFLGPHGWPLGSIDGHVVRLPAKRQREGVLVTATTGAGKSSIVVIPALVEEAELPAPARRSLIVVDAKDELTRASIATLARTHRVLVWDPSKPEECTVGLDPLASLPGAEDEGFVGAVKALAQAWFWATRGGEKTTDPFWVKMPAAVMDALFLSFVVQQPHGTFVELADWTRTLTVPAFQAVLDATPHPAVKASAETLRSLGMSEKTIGPIWSDVLERFSVLDDPRIRRSMTGPPVDSSFVEQPSVLYLRVGAKDAQRLGPLLSMALGQMYGELTKIAVRSGNKLPRECRVIIDEFGNLPRIMGVETALATLRAYGVGHLMLVQTSTQLTIAYGRELAQTIQENLVTKLILGGAGDADAQAFEKRCGETTSYHATRSWSGRGLFRAGGSNFSYSPDRRPLISASEIACMDNEVLVSTRGIRPIRLAAQPYYADPETMDQLEADRLAYEQRVDGGTTPTIEPSSTPAAPEPDRADRDTPPPDCSVEEWDSAAASLWVARWSAEKDLFDLVTGRVADLDQVRERWRANPARSTASRYAKITPAERAKSPAVAKYVDELALRLELRNEPDETSASE